MINLMKSFFLILVMLVLGSSQLPGQAGEITNISGKVIILLVLHKHLNPNTKPNWNPNSNPNLNPNSKIFQIRFDFFFSEMIPRRFRNNDF